MSYRIAIRALGPIIFAYVLWQVDWQHVGVILHKAGTRCFVLAGLLLVPQMVIKALRWRYLLGILGEQVSPYQAVATYFASLLLGILTPGRLGEFTKVYYLHRSIGTDLGRGLSSALADRLYDLAILVAVAIAGLVWLHPPLGIVLSLVVLGVGILATILWRRRSKILNNVETRLKAVLPGDLLDRTGGIGAAVVKDLRLLVSMGAKRALPATVAAYALYFCQILLIAEGLRMGVSAVAMVAAGAVSTLLALLPVSVFGVGVREATLLLLLAPYGVGYELAISYSAGELVVLYLGSAALGMIAWWAAVPRRSTRGSKCCAWPSGRENLADD